MLKHLNNEAKDYKFLINLICNKIVINKDKHPLSLHPFPTLYPTHRPITSLHLVTTLYPTNSPISSLHPTLTLYPTNHPISSLNPTLILYPKNNQSYFIFKSNSDPLSNKQSRIFTILA